VKHLFTYSSCRLYGHAYLTVFTTVKNPSYLTILPVLATAYAITYRLPRMFFKLTSLKPLCFIEQ